jgi:hypothetical protein
MTFSNAYYALTGLAYQRGIDSFDKVMPRERAYSLYVACLRTKGFSWVESSFINWVLCVAGREDRAARPKKPVCEKDCKWRMPYTSNLDLQRNALRVEIFSPSDRCGWRLKSGRMGGRPDDYHPCTHR